MFKTKTYRSVMDMVRDTADDPAFADDLQKNIAERQLVKHLFALRCARGLSQKDIAEAMGCTQGRISKLEASRDDDLSLGDIRAYAKALGLNTILGLEGGSSAVARVKFRYACVKKAVDSLTKLAMRDDGIAVGVARFFHEAAFNFLTLLEKATESLPSEVQPLGVIVELIGPDDQCLVKPARAEESGPESPRRGRKRKLSAVRG
jgi:transcriptional regulator with XRE-family HTH domain